MRRIDELYTRWPFYGSRRIADELGLNRKRVQRLMRLMGIEAVGPKPRTTVRAVGHRVYPYLLRGVSILRIGQVWSTDITYVALRRGWLYLTAVIDWFSRKVLSWRLSNTLDGSFCCEALDEALRERTPEVFKTDQGCQYTARSSRVDWKPSRSRSEWTAAGRRWTTCSSSDCGEA